jgi:hypothetical protein
MLLLAASTHVRANDAPFLTVTAFGAKGDGKTDDTKAIQAAFDAAGQAARGATCWVANFSLPTVVFPAGVYQISETIKLSAFNRVVGEGHAVIRCETPIVAMSGTPHLLYADIEGLTFQEYATAIQFANFVGEGNIDRSAVVIERCSFENRTHNAGLAINSFPDGTNGSNATRLRVESCRFSNTKALRAKSDWAVVEHCWVSGDQVNDYIFENYGALTISNLLGAPGGKMVYTPGEKPVAWVLNGGVGEEGGQVYLYNNRFGGEGGGGAEIVHNTAPANGVIRLQHNVVCVMAYQHQAVMRCFTMPSNLYLLDNLGAWTRGVAFDEGCDIEAYVRTPGRQANNTQWRIAGNTIPMSIDDGGKLASIIDDAKGYSAVPVGGDVIVDDPVNYWPNPFTYFDGRAVEHGGRWQSNSQGVVQHVQVDGPHGWPLSRISTGDAGGWLGMRLAHAFQGINAQAGGPGAGIYTFSFLAKANQENVVDMGVETGGILRKSVRLGTAFQRYTYTMYFDDATNRDPQANTLSIAFYMPRHVEVTFGEFALHRGPSAQPFTFPGNVMEEGMTLTASPVLRGTHPPTQGTWKTGDLMYHTAPQPGGVVGWVCIEGGVPGVWRGFGQISVE